MESASLHTTVERLEMKVDILWKLTCRESHSHVKIQKMIDEMGSTDEIWRIRRKIDLLLDDICLKCEQEKVHPHYETKKTYVYHPFAGGRGECIDYEIVGYYCPKCDPAPPEQVKTSPVVQERPPKSPSPDLNAEILFENS
jgi:hypothetical protein